MTGAVVARRESRSAPAATTLFTVVAPPRAGTQWYSRLFTTAVSFCFHELTALLRPYPSNWAVNEWAERQAEEQGFIGGLSRTYFEPRHRRVLLQAYPDYFARHWERAAFGQHIVGNSDAGILPYVSGIRFLWPSMKFLFSTRNGINVVQSASQLAPVGPEAETIAPDMGLFGASCERWVESMQLIEHHKTRLVERGFDLDMLEVRLEDVTTDASALRRVWDWLVGDWQSYEERNLDLMVTPVNVRINVRRVWSAHEVWERWTASQRETFTAICGETQIRAGYDVPPS